MSAPITRPLAGESERLPAAELRARREYLGLTTANVAAVLDVREDTVRRWESGREPVPRGVRGELEELELGTTQAVGIVCAELLRDDPHGVVALAYRSDEEFRARSEWGDEPGLSARWWRHVVVRAIALAGEPGRVGPHHPPVRDVPIAYDEPEEQGA